MALGFKVADIYAELSVDRDPARRGVRGLASELGPDADRAGRDLGDKVGRGLAASVESWSAKIAKARRAEQIAAQNVTLAEKRLSEARAKGIGDGSRLLALEQQLERANWKLADANTAATTATGKHAAAQRKLAESLTDVGKGLGPAAQRAGEDAGGKLALGMRMSIIRNSPLIVAAVAGGLVAGGPIVATAATGLFAGIGIVSAAQSDKVRSAWLGTWHTVRDGAIADAKAIEPVLVGLADRVGDRFEGMRPQLRGIFSDAAPQIRVFGDGLLDLVENALPGFERAVAAGMPVTRGFADFLAKTGTGLTDFLDRITDHAPAAGQAWSYLGDSMGTLLPILGELLGQGAQLATTALPLLNGGLGLVLSTANALGPALPPIVMGLTGMKIVSSLSGPLGSFSDRLGSLASKNLPGISTAAGGAKTALSRMGSALPGIGIAVGAVAGAMSIASSETDAWVQALLKGGSAARQAQEEAAAVSNDDFVVIGQWLGLVDTFEDVQKKADDYRASLSPLERANFDVTKAQNLLNEKIEEFGPNSNEAEGAARALKSAQGELERQNADLERAVDGVTQAMLDQANQAMGAIDADFAYADSLDQLEDKQKALADAIREHGRASEEASDAQRDYAEGIWETAQNAAKAAPALDGLEEGTKEYDRAVQNLTLKSLVDMRAGLGPEMRSVVDGMIAKLKAGGASLDELGAKKPTPVVDANINPLTGKTQTSFGLLDVLDRQRPTPQAGFGTSGFMGPFGSMMNSVFNLNRQRPSPIATLFARTAGAESALNWAARNRTSTVTQVIRQIGSMVSGFGWGGASGGKVGDVARGFADGGSPQRRSDGKLSGPGGPFDDLIAAITNSGEPIRVANTEWIINGPVSADQGDRKMALLNAGQADIVPREQRAFAAGGRPGPDPLGAAMLPERLSEALDQVVPTRFFERMVEAIAPGMSRAVMGGAPALRSAVTGGAPAIAAAVRSGAPALGDAIRAASATRTAAAAPAAASRRSPVGGSAAFYDFDERRQSDPTYMSWWRSLLAAGWKGNANDGRERVYRPMALGGRFAAGELLRVGEEGEELLRPDVPGTIIPARQTSRMLDGAGIHVDKIEVNVAGTFDFASPEERRRVAKAIAVELRDELVKLEREYR